MMAEGNVKIRFQCDIDELMYIKEKDIWFLDRTKVIIDTKRMRRKGQRKKEWLENLEWELSQDAMELIFIEEKEDKIILDICDMFISTNYILSKESCYEFAKDDYKNREKILRKFRVNNYEVVYDFYSSLDLIEKNKDSLEFKYSSISEVDFSCEEFF